MASNTLGQTATAAKPAQNTPPLVEVWITPTVERNYVARGAFPKLRAAQAARMAGNGATGIFNLRVVEALKVLKDANAQRRDPSLPRGTPKAFTSLVERLKEAIGRAEVVECDDLPKARLKPVPLSKEQADKARAAAAAVDLAQAELAKQPNSPEEFCRRAAEMYWFGYHLFYHQNMQPGYSSSGYRFANALQQCIERVALDLYWEIRNAWKDDDGSDSCEVEFSKVHRDKKLTEALAAAAKSNPRLQAMLVRQSNVSTGDVR